MATPVPPGDILRDTTPHLVAGLDHRYAAHIPEAWKVMFAFGGTTMATALRAATAAVDRPDLDLVSADATFCAAVPCGPVALDVEVLRQGRSGAQALVRLWALDPEDADAAGPTGNDLVLTCVFGRRDESPLHFVGAVAPDVPRPLECATRPIQEDGPFSSINYHHQTEVRPASGFNPWDRDDVPPSEPRTASWFRFREPPIRPDGTWEPGTLAVPADVLGSAVHAGIGSSAGFFLVVSLQISLQLVADARTDWLLQHTRAHVADQGFSTGTAELWGEDGTLVAIATQCARLQPLTPRG